MFMVFLKGTTCPDLASGLKVGIVVQPSKIWMDCLLKPAESVMAVFTLQNFRCVWIYFRLYQTLFIMHQANGESSAYYQAKTKNLLEMGQSESVADQP